MSEAVKVGDEFAVDSAGRFSNYHSWRIVKVVKVTPSGKFRIEGMPNRLFTLSDGRIARAHGGGGGRPSDSIWIYRITENNRERYEWDNSITKLRDRFNQATRILDRRQFNPDLMTDERIKMLEIFINLTEVHS